MMPPEMIRGTRAWLGALCFAALAARGLGETLELQPGTQLELADATTAAQLMGAPDAYLRRMSPFDRAARMRVIEPPSAEDFAKHVAENVRDFSDPERARMQAALAEVRPLLAPLRLAFPERITIVKTNGLEDINEPYCRGPVIVLPQKLFTTDRRDLTHTLLHELFHVFSSQHPELRERLYALLDYRRCTELTLPPREDERRFTNPDAMNFDYYTILRHEEREFAAMPVLLARGEHFDPAAKGGVFAQVALMLVEIEVREGQATPVLDAAGAVVMRPAEAVPAYLQRMARNTGYNLHPEEVLADNFVHLARRTTGLAAPELPVKLLEVMQSAASR